MLNTIQALGVNAMNYENPIPVAIGLIPINSPTGILLLGIRRKKEPAIGQMALPGGYLDKKESAEMACAREVLEEVGLKTVIPEWKILGTRTTDDNRLLVFFGLRKIIPFETYLRLRSESSEVISLELINSNTELAFSFHKEFVDSFFNRQRKSKNQVF